jgi:hypothetical protein
LGGSDAARSEEPKSRGTYTHPIGQAVQQRHMAAASPTRVRPVIRGVYPTTPARWFQRPALDLGRAPVGGSRHASIRRHRVARPHGHGPGPDQHARSEREHAVALPQHRDRRRLLPRGRGSRSSCATPKPRSGCGQAGDCRSRRAVFTAS